MLKLRPVVDEVTVIVAVAVAQVGCVMLIVGADGAPTTALTTALVPVDTQLDAFIAVTVYVAFDDTPVKMPVVFE